MLVATAAASSIGCLSAMVFETLHEYFHKDSTSSVCLCGVALKALAKNDHKRLKAGKPRPANGVSNEEWLTVKRKVAADLSQGLEDGSLSEALDAVNEAMVRAKIERQLLSGLESWSLAAALDVPSWKSKIRQKVQSHLSLPCPLPSGSSLPSDSSRSKGIPERARSVQKAFHERPRRILGKSRSVQELLRARDGVVQCTAVQVRTGQTSDPVVIPMLPLKGLHGEPVSKPKRARVLPSSSVSPTESTFSESAVSTESTAESATTDTFRSDQMSPGSSAGSECMHQHQGTDAFSSKADVKITRSNFVIQKVTKSVTKEEEKDKDQKEEKEKEKDRTNGRWMKGLHEAELQDDHEPCVTPREEFFSSRRSTPTKRQVKISNCWRLDERQRWIRTGPEFFRLDYEDDDSDGDSDADPTERILLGSPMLRPTPRFEVF